MKENNLYDVFLFDTSEKLNFVIDENLFHFFKCKEDFDFPLFDLEVKVQKLNDESFKMDFYLKGNLSLKCDLTLESFIYPMKLNWDLDVKFSSDPFLEDEEKIVLLPFFSKKINIAKMVYEKILLSLPIKRTHPDLKGKDFYFSSKEGTLFN
jgi:uncharacterized metal-binding protein YceD (DUF177 family)